MTIFLTMLSLPNNYHSKPVSQTFFDQDAVSLAADLLGKILMVKHGNVWLHVRIIETEAYTLSDRASHASLGYTPKRQALFATPGTIYMYYSRAGDSLNFSARGDGNAVLVKSGIPILTDPSDTISIKRMIENNPKKDGSARAVERVCSGQALLCRALGLKVKDWDNKPLDPLRFIVSGDDYTPKSIIQTTRLGIHPDRDAHLPYRFIDTEFKRFCTKDPTRVRDWQLGKQYAIFTP